MRTFLIVLFSLESLWSQPPARPTLKSPDVQSDGSVIFRFRAPNAKEVLLGREGTQRVAMTKDEDGVWTYKTDPLEPDYYGYSFVADGVALTDPNNSLIKP